MLNVKNPGSMIENLILFVVAILVLVPIVPKVLDAFTNLSNVAGLPFADFYAADGAAVLLFGAAILLGIFAIIRKKRSGR